MAAADSMEDGGDSGTPTSGMLGWMTQSQALTLTTRAATGFSLGVLLFEAAVYNVVFLGRVLPAAGKEALVVPCMVLFDSLWAMTMWSFLRAHLADAGKVPARWDAFVLESRDNMTVVAPRTAPPGWQPGRATHCRKCAKARPERAHHCAVCGHCVMRYDHHCPWISNCVGFHNQKFFLLLAAYAWLSSFVFLTTSLPTLIYCIGEAARPVDDAGGPMDSAGLGAKRLTPGELFTLGLSTVLGLMVGALLTILLSIHLPLATQNLTSVEDYYDNMPNPFDQGSTAENLAQIFGAYGPDWLIPMKPFRPLSDGIFFPRHDDFRGADGLADGIRGKSEREREELWKVRYHTRLTRPDDSLTTMGPLASLARWFKSVGAETRLIAA